MTRAQAVNVEIRAAGIAAAGGRRSIKRWLELDGWCIASGRHCAGARRGKKTPSKPGEWAGYLAYYICRNES